MANGRSSPARTPQARESQLINLAMKQAEKQLRDGTASPLIVSHFLKLGTARAELEREKIEAETKVAMAKAEFMESQKRSDAIVEEALAAFKSYVGTPSYDEFDDDYEYYDD